MNNYGWGNELGDNNKGLCKQGDGFFDFEELWCDFIQCFGGLFGKKLCFGNNGGGFNGGNMFFNLILCQFGGGVGVIIVLVVVVWLVSGFYIVDVSECGVVLCFGSYS